jgi:Tfp pilus assembly protein PilF
MVASMSSAQTTAACGCGSGLRPARCCHLAVALQVTGGADRHLIPLEEQAKRAREAGDNPAAETLLLDILELAPTRPTALRLLYEIRTEQDVPGAALALIRRLVLFEPNNFWAVNEIALLLLRRGDAADAERHARNAVRIAPDDAQSHYLMGMVLTEMNRPAVGEFHYRRALQLSGSRDASVLANFALCLKNQGKMSEARALYTEALAAAPDNIHILIAAARLEEADRALARALELLDRVESIQPGNASALLLRAVIMGRREETAAAVTIIERLSDAKQSLAPDELLEKGRLLDRLGHHAEAFAAFDLGKRTLRERSGLGYLDSPARQQISRRRDFFVAKRVQSLPRASTRRESAQPLFIVGFPRSGTTLLEQTLSAHPHISAGDELPIIAEITHIMPRLLDSPLTYPDALAELWMADHREDLEMLRDHYLRKAAQLGVIEDGVAWFTDKMPLNECDLGLIHLLFPESPILHVVRHPLDVMLSVYSNLLTHGHFCAYALDTAAIHYVRVMELVEHYRREMPLKYLEVRYEGMVEQQEPLVRKILGFVGVPYDPSCVSFHENRRYARTASYAQVTEKLYDRSTYRYRNYLEQLAPIVPTLQATIERLGYKI